MLQLVKSAYGMILSSKNGVFELQGYLTSKVGCFKQLEADNALFAHTEANGS